MQSSNNAERQIGEIEALMSIYGEELRRSRDGTYRISIAPVARPSLRVDLSFVLPSGYPSDDPPVFELRAEWLRDTELADLARGLESVWREETGEEVVFKWVEWIRENTTAGSSKERNRPSATSTTPSSQAPDPSPDLTPTPTIFHSLPVTDRKSKFVAHLSRVTSVQEVQAVIRELYQDKRIATATHNVVAYRICTAGGDLIEERDDDGEAGAGDKMLYLLHVADVRNVVVVVTRWYGGIHLGPDRFKHFTNIAKGILTDHNLLPTKASGHPTKQKKEKNRHKK